MCATLLYIRYATLNTAAAPYARRMIWTTYELHNIAMPFFFCTLWLIVCLTCIYIIWHSTVKFTITKSACNWAILIWFNHADDNKRQRQYNADNDADDVDVKLMMTVMTATAAMTMMMMWMPTT